MTSWTHLVRFQSGDGVYYGDAIFPDGADPTDIVQIAEAGKLTARIIEADSSPISITSAVKVTEKIVPVSKLLSPVTRDQVPIIRCIGLNYIKHSEFEVTAFMG